MPSVKRMEQSKADLPEFCLRATPFGFIAVVWKIYRGEPGACRILLSKPEMSAEQAVRKLFPRSTDASCSEINVLLDKIESFLVGEDIRFPLDVVRLDICSSFQRKVLHAEHSIPRGAVSTYRLIAKHVGTPYGARAVGMALATNPFPFVIPCHRTIRSDGTLGGYGGGQNMKRTLLEMEGVTFRDTGHVATEGFFYEDQLSV